MDFISCKMKKKKVTKPYGIKIKILTVVRGQARLKTNHLTY